MTHPVTAKALRNILAGISAVPADIAARRAKERAELEATIDAWLVEDHR